MISYFSNSTFPNFRLSRLLRMSFVWTLREKLYLYKRHVGTKKLSVRNFYHILSILDLISLSWIIIISNIIIFINLPFVFFKTSKLSCIPLICNLPIFVMKNHISLIIITTKINKLIAIDTNSRRFLIIGNDKISKEFLMSRYVRVVILLIWMFLPGIDK